MPEPRTAQHPAELAASLALNLSTSMQATYDQEAAKIEAQKTAEALEQENAALKQRIAELEAKLPPPAPPTA